MLGNKGMTLFVEKDKKKKSYDGKYTKDYNQLSYERIRGAVVTSPPDGYKDRWRSYFVGVTLVNVDMVVREVLR